MTRDEVLVLLARTSARLEREQRRWYRKRARMSDNDNEKLRAIADLGDELAALHIASAMLRKESK